MRKFKKAYVEITNMCNKSCSFCHGTKREPHAMTQAEFLRVLDQLDGVTEYLYFHVLGEPLCHPQLEEFVKIATSNGFRVTVTTNGTLLDVTYLDIGVYKFQISLHSFEASDKDAHRAYLDRALSFAKSAGERGILVSLRLWNIGAHVSNSLAEERIKEYFPNPSHSRRDDGLILSDNVYLSYANRFEWQDMNSPDVNTTLFCYGLRDQIAILSNGTVVPCCMDCEGDIPLGNIYNTTLDQIIATPRALAIYDGFSRRQPVEPLCKKCTYAKRFDIK